SRARAHPGSPAQRLPGARRSVSVHARGDGCAHPILAARRRGPEPLAIPALDLILSAPGVPRAPHDGAGESGREVTAPRWSGGETRTAAPGCRTAISLLLDLLPRRTSFGNSRVFHICPPSRRHRDRRGVPMFSRTTAHRASHHP